MARRGERAADEVASIAESEMKHGFDLQTQMLLASAMYYQWALELERKIKAGARLPYCALIWDERYKKITRLGE